MVTLLYHGGECYADTSCDDGWLDDNDLRPDDYAGTLEQFERSCSRPG